jgi:subtilisin family serine protease
MAIFTTDVSRKNRGFNIGQDNAGDPEGLYTNNFGGTSAATPIAASIAALMLSVNPDLSCEQVRQIMRDTAEKIDRQNGRYDENGFSQFYGYGRLNAYRAVREALIQRQLREGE